ncbi:MAG: TIR domain-containing protein [Phycisphaerales bacterium JB060]
MSQRHKVFVSYHHANDENYKNTFERRFGDQLGILVRGSVQLGDIDETLQTETIRRRIREEYLRDSSVTVVLIGTETWKRKHVDWEISASIRQTDFSPRSGLLGLFLPSHPAFRQQRYDPHTIPPRLYDNVECGYARLAHWTDDPATIQDLIHQAYVKKRDVQPTNARDLFARNRTGDRWTD